MASLRYGMHRGAEKYLRMSGGQFDDVIVGDVKMRVRVIELSVAGVCRVEREHDSGIEIGFVYGLNKRTLKGQFRFEQSAAELIAAA